MFEMGAETGVVWPAAAAGARSAATARAAADFSSEIMSGLRSGSRCEAVRRRDGMLIRPSPRPRFVTTMALRHAGIADALHVFEHDGLSGEHGETIRHDEVVLLEPFDREIERDGARSLPHQISRVAISVLEVRESVLIQRKHVDVVASTLGNGDAALQPAWARVLECEGPPDVRPR